MRKIKTKKCALRSCGKEFKPNPWWQRYHSAKCRWTVVNKKNMALLRRAKKALKAQEKAQAAANQ